MAFDIFINALEVRVVANDVILPNGFDGLDEGMVNFDIVFIEDIVGFDGDVNNIFLPATFKFLKFHHLSNTLINQMLDFAVNDYI
jgi:hypothetical protein